MRLIDNFERDLQKAYNNWVSNLMEAQQEACQKICEDIKEQAPVDTGEYKESIKVSETVRLGNIIRTEIYSGYTLDDANKSDTPTLPEWANVPLAVLIESGTRPHIITPRDPMGKLRWEDEDGIHFAKLVHHTGTAPNPHWTRAIMENQAYYRKKMRKARWKI